MFQAITRWLRSRSVHSAHKVPKVRKRKHLFPHFEPTFERLEKRWLMATLQFSASTANVDESEYSVALNVTLSQTVAETVTVDYATSSGTATGDSDYYSATDTLTFYPDDTSETLYIELIGDVNDENNETFTITLSNPSNATLGSPTTNTVTILDDDPLPTLDFSSSTYSEAESAGKATITVTLSAASGKTVSVNYATSAGSATAGTDYTSASSALTFNPGQTSRTFDVYLTDDEASESSETVNLAISSPTNAGLGTTTSATLTITNSSPSGWYPTGLVRGTDHEQGAVVGFGAAAVKPQNGGLQVVQPLDVRKSVPSEQDAWSALQAPVALVYQSDTVNVKPLLEVTFDSGSSGTVPTQLEAQLTWNNGSPQSWVTFTVSGHAQGDKYVLAQQVSSAVTSSGRYPWSVSFKATFSNRGQIYRTVSGTTDVTVHGSSSPFGHGWTVSSLDKLVTVSGGVVWYYGVGGSRTFTFSETAYFSPNDFGELKQNGDSSWTYTSKELNTWHFDSSGVLQKIVDTHGLTRTYTYASGRLSTISEPDGGVTTFAYDVNNLLEKVTQPGTRVVTVVHDGNGDLTSMILPDGARPTFSYDNVHRLETQRQSPLHATMVYDSGTSALASINRGLSSTLSLTPAAVQGLTTSPAKRTTDIVAVLTDALSQKTTLTLDALARQTALTTPDGVTRSWTRDSAGLATRMTVSSQTTTYTWEEGFLALQEEPEGRILEMIDEERPVGEPYPPKPMERINARDYSTSYTYNAAWDPLVVRNALSERTTMTWSSGLLQTVTDPLNRTTTYLYDANRRVETIIDALSNRTTMTYDAAGNVATIKDALSRVTSFTYDGMRRVLTQTNALGGVATVVYNAIGQATQQTDPLGRVTEFDYDQRGWKTATREAVGSGDARTTTMVYDVLGRETSRIDGRGNTVTMTYDAVGRLKTQTSPVGGIETLAYDTYGNVTAQTDGLNHTNTFTYDNLNRRVTEKDALGNVVTTVYDAESNVTVRIDERGKRATMTYDALNRLETAKNALAEVVTFVYDAAGNQTRVINARGYGVTFSYDALHQRTAVTDQLGNTVTSVYDAVGNVIRTVDAENRSTTFTFDNLNRQVTSQDPAAGVFTLAYDAVGNVLNTIDQLGNKATFVYDNLNRKTKAIDARGGVITMVHDAADNLTKLIDPIGNTTTFVFDAANRQTEEKDPLGNSVTFAYDLANRLTSRTDRLSRRRDVSYDNANHPTGEVWKSSGGSTVNTLTFTYDAAGNQLTALESNGTYTLTYDDVNRVANVQQPFGQRLTFTYDAAGNRTKVEDSFGGIATSTYDAANRLTKREFGGASQTPLRMDITYTGRNQVATQTRYSDLAGTTKIGESLYTYDTSGRLENLKHKNGGGTILANYTHTYDVAHRVLTEMLNGTTTTYQYDATNQLTQDTTTTYTYDLNGNRTMSGYQTGTGNRLTNDGVYTYTYDAEGNLTKKSKGASLETWEYGYDHRNQMTWAEKRATDGGTLQMRADYKYDVYGNRIEKAVDADGAGGGGTTTTRFVLDGWKVQQDALGNQPQRIGNEAWDIWADVNGSNALQTRYVRGDVVDELFARISSGGTAAWYLNDLLGSGRDLIDGTGVVQDHIEFDGYGNITSETNPSFGDRFEFTGREFDGETGLQYNRARFYDRLTGRWVNKDPIGFQAGDANLYRYTDNSPRNRTDPSGMEIRLYRMSNIAGQGGHVTILWYDPNTNTGVEFTGSGPGRLGYAVDLAVMGESTGSFQPTTAPADPWTTVLTFPKGDPDKNYPYECTVVPTGLTASEEWEALWCSFEVTNQVPYYSHDGPNSNTWGHQLLENAGFDPPTPPNAPGWDYDGSFGYGGTYFDEYGNPKPAWGTWWRNKLDKLATQSIP